MNGIGILLRQVEELGDYDLHDVLRRQKKVEWCDPHINIGQNHNVIGIAEKFHRQIKKNLKSTSSITSDIDTIERTFLEFLPTDHKAWDVIRNRFKEARAKDNPIPIIKAYTVDQNLTKRLNLHSAVNTYHSLKLYCTLLNCPILAQTQEYTEAFSRILFHPKLEKYLVRNMEVYRGTILDNKKFVDNYKEGATIITTTFLSTSTEPAVAAMFCDAGGNTNLISVFCTYNIKGTQHHTALDLRDISVRPDEKEILILRYIPFKIRSVQRNDNGRRLEIYFDEYEEQSDVEETHF